MFWFPASSANNSLSVKLQFRSAQPAGLLYAQEKVALYLLGGRVALKWCSTASECAQLVTAGTYNSGQWCSIEVTMETGREALLSVNGTEALIGNVSQVQELASGMYLGGTPVPAYGGGVQKYVWRSSCLQCLTFSTLPSCFSYTSFAGCMAGFVLGTVPVNISDAVESNRVYPLSCPSEVRGAWC